MCSAYELSGVARLFTNPFSLSGKPFYHLTLLCSISQFLHPPNPWLVSSLREALSSHRDLFIATIHKATYCHKNNIYHTCSRLINLQKVLKIYLFSKETDMCTLLQNLYFNSNIKRRWVDRTIQHNIELLRYLQLIKKTFAIVIFAF